METKTISTQELIAARQYGKDKAFWSGKLADLPGKSIFHYDFKPAQRKENNENNPQVVTFHWDGELVERLEQVSNESYFRLYMILAAGLVVLINKYTGLSDVMIGTPVIKQEADVKFINTVLVLRNPIHDTMTFKELLLLMRETISEAADHVNYPVELVAEQLGLPGGESDDFPFFDISILLENIHHKKYLRHIRHNVAFSFQKTGSGIEGNIEYNASRYHPETIEAMALHYGILLRQALENVNITIDRIELLSEKEKDQLVEGLNNTQARLPNRKLIDQWFSQQAKQNPHKTAVVSPIDFKEFHELFSTKPLSCRRFDQVSIYRVKKNPYLFQWQLECPGKEKSTPSTHLTVFKTNRHNSVIVNPPVVKLLELFDGKRNVKQIYSRLEKVKLQLLLYPVEIGDILEISFVPGNVQQFSLEPGLYENFFSLVQALYQYHLIIPVGINAGVNFVPPAREDFPPVETRDPGEIAAALPPFLKGHSYSTCSRAEVLLLGDTPGVPTTGLLYLASYLKRNGISAYCQFYDFAVDFDSMRKNIEMLLETLQPRLVAVSLKWFLYIARVLDTCKIVKEFAGKHSRSIKVVVGGNTASYYWNRIIPNDCIDYIIRGDGEEPLLDLCRGKAPENIPNCVYKKNGKIMKNPITYVQDESHSRHIYLSHLDGILLAKHVPAFGTFFIYTHKGCTMNCLYCGGCNRAQQVAFNRKKVMKRGIKEVRRDILEARKFTSTFQFDFENPGIQAEQGLLDYCQAIWQGIDLTAHFCILSTLTPPTAPFIRLAARTFKYIYWDFDVCTLSGRHREQLVSLGLVKPLPADDEILLFLERCDLYDNIRVRINLITGLPFFTPADIDAGKKLLSGIMETHSCFEGLHWARLHAQPGAPVLENARTYHMHAYAENFDDFFAYSKKNNDPQSSGSQNGVEHLAYPYIYYDDDQLNAAVTRFYHETDKKIGEYQEKKKQEALPSMELTYRQLDENTDILAAILRQNGVRTNTIVGIMVPPSPDIPLAILAVLKAGAAFLPISPGYPGQRIRYMLEDSRASLLLTTRTLYEDSKIKTGKWEGKIILLHESIINSQSQPGDRERRSRGEPGSGSANLSYIVYTSGTTGKPKGVVLTHENLANYAYWFIHEARLTGKDKTILTSSFTFDLGYTSIFPSLLKGGQLHLVPRDLYLLAEGLLTYINRNRITYIKVTPSLLTVLVNSRFFSSTGSQSLRLAVVGGEPVNVPDIKKLHDICPHIKVMNHYGPTEATIGSVATFIDFNAFKEYQKNPFIGQPINNVSVYILDNRLKLLPGGVPGELCISGICLARGYLNQPELTVEKFISPQSHKINFKQNSTYSLLYRTGDLARRMPDGNIQFLDRIDNQVKIRGYRVETEEIKHKLLKHPQIKDAVVIDRQDKDGGNYLCAYIVPGIDSVSLLTGKEQTRYSRQMLLEGWGLESQEKLKRTRVFVAGAGGGASPTITQLALAGIGTIVVCDHDNVELSNLNRQFLHDHSRIGMNKALSTKINIERINPNVNVIPITKKLTGENVSELVGEAALILDMFDDLEAKFILSRCALEKNIPHITAAMTDISSYSAIFHPPQTPCFHCLFDRKKFNRLVSGMKTVIKNNEYEKNPLPVAVPSLFVSTGFAVNEAIKIILGIRNPAYNKFLFFNQGGTPGIGDYDAFRAMSYTYSHHFRKLCKQQGFDWDKGWSGNFLEEFTITPDPHCPLCGKNRIKLSPPQPGPQVSATGKSYPLSRLQEFLLQTLPEYMIPAYVVRLPAIPLTPNGKIDKKLLPEPKSRLKKNENQYIPPTNEVEEKLAEIWAEVLEIPENKISIDNNFFQLGGHSLKATLMVSRVHEEMNQSLSLAEVFTNPTIKGLAKVFMKPGTSIPRIKDENLVLLRTGTHHSKHIFFIHAGSGEVDGYMEFCNHLNPRFNCWGIKTTGIKNYAPISISIEEVSRNYVNKIKKIQPQGPYYIAGWCIGGTIAFEMARQLEQQDKKIAVLALINTSPPQPGKRQSLRQVTFPSELKWITEFLAKNHPGIKKQLSHLTHLTQLWPRVVEYLTANATPESVRKLFPKNIADATPNFDQLGIKELIYYFNTIRSYSNSRDAYIPAAKNNTPLYFFGANEAEIINRDTWNLYCSQPLTFYKISGDHFSIFRKPHAELFARTFDRVILSGKGIDK